MSVTAIVIIIAFIVAMKVARLAELSLLLLTAVILQNASGLLSGDRVPRLMAYGPGKCVRCTLAIEVGMQNSGLAVALAVKYFTLVAALLSPIFSTWHNPSGSLLRRCGDASKNEFLLSN